MHLNRLMNNHFIDQHNNTLVNAVLAKFAHEHDSRELIRAVDKIKYSRRHHELMIAVMVLDQQNTLKKIMDEQRHCGDSFE